MLVLRRDSLSVSVSQNIPRTRALSAMHTQKGPPAAGHPGRSLSSPLKRPTPSLSRPPLKGQLPSPQGSSPGPALPARGAPPAAPAWRPAAPPTPAGGTCPAGASHAAPSPTAPGAGHIPPQSLCPSLALLASPMQATPFLRHGTQLCCCPGGVRRLCAVLGACVSPTSVKRESPRGTSLRALGRVESVWFCPSIGPQGCFARPSCPPTQWDVRAGVPALPRSGCEAVT